MFEITQELIDRQLENEKEQIQGGIDRYRNNLKRLKEKGEFGATLPGRWFVETCFPTLVDKFESEIDNALSGKPGRRMAAMKYISLLSGETLTFLTLRLTINVIMQGKHEKTRIAQHIGRAIQEELHHLAMRTDSTKTKAYRYWTHRAETASHSYTKKRCLDKLKSLYDPEIFIKLGSKEQVEMGVTCLEFVMQSMPNVLVETIKKLPGDEHPRCLLDISTFFDEQIMQINDRMESLWPHHDPMLVPPKPWDGAFQGGYIGDVGQRTKLVRTSKRLYLEDLDLHKDRLSSVFKALNAIQATPWRINRKIFDVIDAVADMPLRSRFGLPALEDRKLPNRLPESLQDDPAAIQAHALEIQEVRDFNNTRVGNARAFSFTRSTARKYMSEKAIYFPHNLDWRGRIYPMASYISPQGSELSRSLLEFASGKPLKTPSAAGWLAVHGANCFGFDKVSFEERISWVRENEEKIKRSATAPLDFSWWAEADCPWMFLAWCFEWYGYLKNGLEHVSHIPVAMDGSCNGLQNFAAMLRHEATAKAVNLAPADKPNDIYKQVAKIVSDRVKILADSRTEPVNDLYKIVKDRTNKEINAGRAGDDDKKETGKLWNILSAKWINGQITRTLVKRPVMTYPYAVSMFGVKEQLTGTLKELYRAGKIDIPYEHASKIAFMLQGIVYQTVREEVKAAAEAMDWLKHVAGVVSSYNLPVAWFSPAGLPIIQEYKKKTGRRINTTIGNQRLQLLVAEDTDTIDPRSQASAIAPNFVHSCDASHLMLTVNACLDQEISDFHMIHDSYGTHACNTPLLAKTLREKFIDIYSGNVLDDFRAYIIRSLPQGAELDIPKPPMQGGFDLKTVMNSKYFFI